MGDLWGKECPLWGNLVHSWLCFPCSEPYFPLEHCTFASRGLGVRVSRLHRSAQRAPQQGRHRRVGRDSSDPVSTGYDPPFSFIGGRTKVIEINIGNDVYLDLERDFHAAMARD